MSASYPIGNSSFPPVPTVCFEAPVTFSQPGSIAAAEQNEVRQENAGATDNTDSKAGWCYKVRQGLSDIGKTIRNFFASAWAKLRDFFSAIGEKVKNFFSGEASDVSSRLSSPVTFHFVDTGNEDDEDDVIYDPTRDLDGEPAPRVRKDGESVSDDFEDGLAILVPPITQRLDNGSVSLLDTSAAQEDLADLSVSDSVASTIGEDEETASFPDVNTGQRHEGSDVGVDEGLGDSTAQQLQAQQSTDGHVSE
ncbi:hypothetical protein ACUSIJ_09610 [Pseudochelatococcus sp. B33]